MQVPVGRSAALPGCIAEMLIQSHLEKCICYQLFRMNLNRKVSGLKARGNYKIDMEWKTANWCGLK